jgi:hypothetical protein
MAEASGKSNIIRVPKTPKSSYNPNRPIKGNTLLEHQLKNLRALELRLPQEQQTGLDFSAIDTEGEASEYVRRMTVILHPQAKKSSGR